MSNRRTKTLATVACQTDKSGPEKRRRRRKSIAATVTEILEKGDKDEDLRKFYDEFENLSDDEDDLYENIQIQKEIIKSVRYQPWTMSKKQNLVKLAKSYVEKHEGKLSRSHGYQEKGAQFWRRIKREFSNLVNLLTPWDMRVKAIESHFGSVVASYFLFLRWLVGINVSLTLLPVCFVIIPELAVGEPHGTTERKQLPGSQRETYADLKTIWDAEGIVRFSLIFYGYYGNSDKIGAGYRLPLAYLLTGFASFAFSFIVVLRKMASNSRLSRLSSKDEQFTFSWRLFGSWDYTIGQSETANTKSASIVTTFKELILEEKEKEKDMNRYTLLGLRVLANIGVLMTLAISTYIIQLCVERSRELDIRKRNDENYVASFWEENELTVVMTLIATIFPNFFDLFAMMEKYHPRITLRWQLGRIFLLNLLNLYTLFIALFWKQQDMKNAVQEKITKLSENCTDTPFNIPTTTGASTNHGYLGNVTTNNCSVDPTKQIESDLCWETMIGQEVFKLTIMDLVFVLGQILIQDFIRGLFVRFCNPLCCWDLETKFPEYGDFKTTENILHLINNQGMIWLGTFFAPGLVVLNLLKLVILLYVRCWSVMVCNVPQEAIFRSSRSNNFYYALLLIMLFLTMLPPLFAIVAVEPSPHCGPFSGQKQILHILTDTIERDLPTVVATVIEYTVSPFVILPVFMLLGMTLYYLVVVSRSLREANKELRNQLEYERTEGKRKIYAMADAKWELNAEGTNNKRPKDAIKGQSEKKTCASKGKGALGKAAMSVLAASRIAKMLSSKNTPKVGPSASTVIQKKMMPPDDRDHSPSHRADIPLRHLETEDDIIKDTGELNLPTETPIAIVHASQKFRKKNASNVERTTETRDVPQLWRRAAQRITQSSTRGERRQPIATLSDDIDVIIEESTSAGYTMPEDASRGHVQYREESQQNFNRIQNYETSRLNRRQIPEQSERNVINRIASGPSSYNQRSMPFRNPQSLPLEARVDE